MSAATKGGTPRQTPDADVVLVGRPQSLRGELPIANAGEDDIVVSGLMLHSEAARQGPVRASGSTVVPAGASASMPLSIALDPHLPAGEYTGEIEVSGEVRRVVLHVTEEVDLDVRPDRIHVTPGGRPSTTTTIVLTNRGNVAVRLPATASAEAGDAGTLTVRLGAKATSIEPGETRAVRITVTIPDGVDPAMRCDVPLSLGPQDVTVVILPTADDTTTPKTARKPRPLL